VAAPSKAWVCGLSFVGIAGSNGAGGLCFFECFMLSGRGLCYGPMLRPEKSYFVCVCVRVCVRVCVCVCVCV
jgi:hypothetical protein